MPFVELVARVKENLCQRYISLDLSKFKVDNNHAGTISIS